MNLTGRAMGTLNPSIYFEAPNGYVILAPQEVGHDLSLARKIYEERYRPQGWEWREAGTLSEVDALQERLIEQEEKRISKMIEVNDYVRSQIRSQTGDNLRQRMVSAATTPFERDAIKYYLMLRDSEKRNKYRAAMEQHNFYLWAREMDSGTKFEDRMKSEPGDIWRA